MAPTVAEKAICEECGVDVRENTYFCYNCGNSVVGLSSADEKPAEDGGLDDIEALPVEKPNILPELHPSDQINSKGKAALESLAHQIKIERESGDDSSIARAAARRRRARSVRRKGSEYVWEPVEDLPGRPLMLLVGVIVLLAGLAVTMTVIWK